MDRELYPTESLHPDSDNGTMPANVTELGEAVIGHRITKVEKTTETTSRWGDNPSGTTITLDNGKQVNLINTDDCCAYTEIKAFLLHPERVDHIITGIGTTDGYQTWHIYADAGDILELTVDWSCGNPFYYAYGFEIQVKDQK